MISIRHLRFLRILLPPCQKDPTEASSSSFSSSLMANTRCCPPRSREFQSKRSFFCEIPLTFSSFHFHLDSRACCYFNFLFFLPSPPSISSLANNTCFSHAELADNKACCAALSCRAKSFLILLRAPLSPPSVVDGGGEGFRIQMTNHSSKLGGSRPTAAPAQFRRHVRRTEESESAPPAHDPSPVSPLPSSSVSGLSARRRKGTVPSPIFFGFMFSPSFTSSSLLVFLTAKREGGENGERCVESAACLSGSVYLTIDWNRGRENQEGQLFYIVALLFLLPLSRPKIDAFFSSKERPRLVACT